MRRSDYRGAKCVKRKLSKCEDVCRTYGDLQYKFADLLETSDDIASFQVNVEMTGLKIDGKFTTDFDYGQILELIKGLNFNFGINNIKTSGK